MPGTGGKEAAAVTALCVAPAVILDAEVFAALAARDLLAVLGTAFGDRLRYVPLTATLLLTNVLSHLYVGFVPVSEIASQITSYSEASSEGERLSQAAQIREVAARWDSDWAPPRAEAAVMSLLAARTHRVPVITAYPNAERLLSTPQGLCRIVEPVELCLFLAHRSGHTFGRAASLAVDLGATFEPRRSAWWSGQLPRLVALADAAENGSLCNAH